MTTTTTTNNRLAVAGHKHEAIMLHLLANPAEKLGDVARHFNVQPAWLSTIIHSHAFQDKFADMREQYYGNVTMSLSEQLLGLAHLATEKLAEKLEESEDAAFIASTSNMLFTKLGFGSKASVTVQAGDGANITMNAVTPEALQRAEESRRRLRELKALEHQIIEGSMDEST